MSMFDCKIDRTIFRIILGCSRKYWQNYICMFNVILILRSADNDVLFQIKFIDTNLLFLKSTIINVFSIIYYYHLFTIISLIYYFNLLLIYYLSIYCDYWLTWLSISVKFCALYVYVYMFYRASRYAIAVAVVIFCLSSTHVLCDIENQIIHCKQLLPPWTVYVSNSFLVNCCRL